MRWRLAPKLNEVFAQIGLNDFDTGSLERRVELDFLGHHRFGFGNQTGIVLPCDLHDDLGSLLWVRSSMDVKAVPLQAF